MNPHFYVKERAVGNSHYFHVRIKTCIQLRKIESQCYIFFKPSDGSREAALEQANKKATHYEKRHDQLREARDKRDGFLTHFFTREGQPKAFDVVILRREGRSITTELIVQKSVDGKQYKKSRVLPKVPDRELLIFDRLFNEQFQFLCDLMGFRASNPHVQVAKALLRSILSNRYQMNAVYY